MDLLIIKLRQGKVTYNKVQDVTQLKPSAGHLAICVPSERRGQMLYDTESSSYHAAYSVHGGCALFSPFTNTEEMHGGELHVKNTMLGGGVRLFGITKERFGCVLKGFSKIFEKFPTTA